MLKIKESYKFYQNKNCRFYPYKDNDRVCHKGDPETHNCLFCWCPLYTLDCGGDYTITDKGVKDCSKCLLPHEPENYEYIVEKIKEVNDND